ncbi:hypothetical protein ACF3MZ_29130 [Paenibacillaceae bacterium WGS1546]|uniref:hypothetical protein n=1 Tax=Cohnella sp. WGS1546 TaxID=3366810 RepID=UPI00372D1356
MGKKQAGATFTKAQILASNQFGAVRKDALQALLDDEAKITVAEAKQILKQFESKEVV